MDCEFNALPRETERPVGFRPDLTEIAAATVELQDSRARVTDLFHRLVKIEAINGSLTAYSTELTGITAEMLDKYGKPAPEAMSAFYSFVGKRSWCAWGNDPAILEEVGLAVPRDKQLTFFNMKPVVATLYAKGGYDELRSLSLQRAINVVTGLRGVFPSELELQVDRKVARPQAHCALVDALRDAFLFVEVINSYRIGVEVDDIISR